MKNTNQPTMFNVPQVECRFVFRSQADLVQSIDNQSKQSTASLLDALSKIKNGRLTQRQSGTLTQSKSWVQLLHRLPKFPSKCKWLCIQHCDCCGLGSMPNEGTIKRSIGVYSGTESWYDSRDGANPSWTSLQYIMFCCPNGQGAVCKTVYVSSTLTQNSVQIKIIRGMGLRFIYSPYK